jgi:hypothetical protein
MTTKPSPAEFAAHFDELVRTMPPIATLRHDTPENHEWLGLAAHLVQETDGARGLVFRMEMAKLYSGYNRMPGDTEKLLVSMVQQCKMEWRFKSSGSLAVAFEPRRPFDYFDEVRKHIESATTEVFFIDPYMDADFVSRYMPFVKPGVAVRLLGSNKIMALKAAVEMYSAQTGTSIALRHSMFHDRYLIIDGRECYQSSGSFNHGAATSASLLVQIVDAFDSIKSMYEARWAAGTVHL